MTRGDVEPLRAAYQEISEAMQFPLDRDGGPRALIKCSTLMPVMEAIADLLKREVQS